MPDSLPFPKILAFAGEDHGFYEEWASRLIQLATPLSEGGGWQPRRVRTPEELAALLSGSQVAALVLDQLSLTSGVEALQECFRASQPESLIFWLTGLERGTSQDALGRLGVETCHRTDWEGQAAAWRWLERHWSQRLRSRALETRMARLTETASEGLLDCHLGVVQRANPAAARLLRSGSEDSLRGRRFVEFLEPQERPAFLAWLEGVEASGMPATRTETGLLQDTGGECRAEIAAFPYWEGRQVKIQIALRDKSESAATREALRQTKDHLEAILQGVVEGVTALSPEGKLVFANSAAAHFMGYASVEALMASDLASLSERFELMDEKGEPLSWADLPTRRVFAGEKECSRTIGWKRRGTDDVRYSEVSARPVLDAKGGIALVINTTRDITESRTSEQRLRRSETWFRALLDAVPQGLALVDGENVRLANASLLEILQKGRSQVEDHAIEEIFPAGAAALLRRMAKEAGAIEEQGLPLEDADGSARRFDVRCELLPRLPGAMRALVFRKAGWAGTAIPETLLALLNQEIRTPISGTLAMTRLIEETPLQGLQREYVRLLRQSVDSLEAVVGQVLSLALPDSGSRHVEFQDFVLDDILGELTAFFLPSAAQKGLSLKWKRSPEVPSRLRGDPVRLRQVLLPLLGDAIHRSAAGDLTLVAKRPGGTTDATRVQFRVAGSAPQAEGRESIGRSLAEPLIRDLGGVWEEGGGGKGSGVRLVIPFSLPLEPAQARTQGSSAGDTQARVLVVEDHPINQQVILQMLERMGVLADLAEDGEAALKLWEERPYPLIFMDCHLPGISGIDAASAIREKEKTTGGHSVIVALTADAMDRTRSLCFAAGMEDFLSKPLFPEELLKVLIKHLPGYLDRHDLGLSRPPPDERRARMLSWRDGRSQDSVDQFVEATEAGFQRLEKAWAARDFTALEKEVRELETRFGAEDAAFLERECQFLGAAVEAKEIGRILERLEVLKSDWRETLALLESLQSAYRIV